MKPFLAIDRTDNGKNAIVNGAEIAVMRAPQEKIDALGEAQKKVLNIDKPSKFSPLLGIISFGLIICGALCSYAVIDDVFENGFGIFTKAPWMIIIPIACFVLVHFITKDNGKKEATTTERGGSLDGIIEYKSVCNEIETCLGVPKNAVEVDILSFVYKDVGGTIKPIGQGESTFVNVPHKLFLRDGALAITDREFRYEIPLGAIKGFEHIQKLISFSNWNKSISYNSGEYKKWDITGDEGYLVKGYDILHFSVNGEEWGIYFPCYETETVKVLLELN